MEAKLVALLIARKEAEWLRKFLLEIVLWPQLMLAIAVNCDSEATMFRALNKVYNGKSRHISLRHDYVKQLIIDGIITIHYVKNSENLVDPFTKGLVKELVRISSVGMGLKSLC